MADRDRLRSDDVSLPENFENILLGAPLYDGLQFEVKEIRLIDHFLYSEITIDCPCIYCHRDSTFRADEQLIEVIRDKRYFKKKFLCTRQNAHSIIFYFMVEGNNIIKIGQYPSVADLTLGDIKKYQKVLSNEKYIEFSKAIGLSAHGIGIGSFVYLRRIFEDLIEEAHKEAMKLSDWNEEEYSKKRMDEKISALQHYLPKFLVDNKKHLYGILSKGIHELKEDECNSMFPALKSGIELILDEKMEQREKQAKIKAAEVALQKFNQGLSHS
jgi:hypothetical protein